MDTNQCGFIEEHSSTAGFTLIEIVVVMVITTQLAHMLKT